MAESREFRAQLIARSEDGDDATRALVHRQAGEAEIRQHALHNGLVLMRDDGERLVQTGVTSREELLRVTRD